MFLFSSFLETLKHFKWLRNSATFAIKFQAQKCVKTDIQRWCCESFTFYVHIEVVANKKIIVLMFPFWLCISFQGLVDILLPLCTVWLLLNSSCSFMCKILLYSIILSRSHFLLGFLCALSNHSEVSYKFTKQFFFIIICSYIAKEKRWITETFHRFAGHRVGL